jgi:two-component system, cell cycle response regulator
VLERRLEAEPLGESETKAALSVLVVDDEEPALAAMFEAVTTLGHRCRVASSGTEALRMHQAQPADVIMSDWRMAGMDGLELCRRVRALDGGTYTYLLFTTGRATKHDIVEAVRAGADDYVPKPFDLDELEARLIAAGRVVRAYRALAERNVALRHDGQASFRAARIDPLTGIANRLRLEEDLGALQARLLRYGHRLAIAMCDLDQFKRYNDHYGHVAGDEALVRVAQAIQESLRQGDQVYRYGGEEFLVVLPEQGVDAASAAMARVRKAVERLAIAHAPGSLRPIVTVSIGLAPLLPSEALPVRAAIEAADRALYAAKARGGDQVATLTPALQ